MRRHDASGVADGHGHNGCASLVGHFEGTVFEGHKSAGAGACAFGEGAEVYSFIKPLHPILQRQKLTPPIRPIHQHVLRNLNRLPQNGNLLQFLLGDEFVIVPSDDVSDEGNVHPGIVVGDEHCLAPALVKLLHEIPILNNRKTSRKSHQQRAPAMTQEYGQPPLLVQLASRNLVE